MTEIVVDGIVSHLIQIYKYHSDSESLQAEPSKQEFSRIAPIEDSNTSAAFKATLQDHVLIHATTASKESQCLGSIFDGSLLKIGAVRRRRARKFQKKAYFVYIEQLSKIGKSCAAIYYFSIASATLLVATRVLFRNENIRQTFEAHTVDNETIIFLSINEMEKFDLLSSNVQNALIHVQSELSAHATRVHELLFVHYNRRSNYFLTVSEQRRPHPSLDHLLADK